MRMNRTRFFPALIAAGLVLVACGGTETGGTPSPAVVPSDLSISSFTQDFSYMPKLLGELELIRPAGHFMR